MKKIISGLALFALAVLTVFPAAAKSKNVSLYTMQHFESKDERCQSQFDCTHFSADYPVLGSFLNPKVRELVNQSILKELLGTQETSNLALQGEQFIQAYHQHQKTTPAGAGMQWFRELKIAIEFINPDMLGLRISAYEFSGGAHGNDTTQFRNYDLRTGQRLSLNDLFKPGYQKALNQEAEKVFRTQKQLTRWQSLEAAGFTFPNNRFAINNTLLMTPTGLVVHFNTYEIAPYVSGPTEIEMDYSAISDWIKGWGQDDALISLMQQRF